MLILCWCWKCQGGVLGDSVGSNVSRQWQAHLQTPVAGCAPEGIKTVWAAAQQNKDIAKYSAALKDCAHPSDADADAEADASTGGRVRRPVKRPKTDVEEPESRSSSASEPLAEFSDARPDSSDALTDCSGLMPDHTSDEGLDKDDYWPYPPSDPDRHNGALPAPDSDSPRHWH
jgi:hypothetical protein